MDAKTQAGAKGGAKTPVGCVFGCFATPSHRYLQESIVEEAYKGIVAECAFYATLPEHHDVSVVSGQEFIDSVERCGLYID